MLLHLTTSIISDGKNVLSLYQQLLMLNVFKSAALTPTDTKKEKKLRNCMNYSF